ncbi:MAG TPA: hypothetical protein VEL75_15500 [Candidatus Methylomirabilis sp.]|nr:hypothetical protein [Candidatus Methylomirabilis sp.]
MRALALLLLLSGAVGPAAARSSLPASSGECSHEGGVSVCLYRSLLPSVGIVAACRDADCRVGHYYGKPADAEWLAPPPGLATLPRPEVIWYTSTLAQIRFDTPPHGSWSYFFEATRRRLSAPRADVLGIDPRRLLAAQAEERAIVVRQIFAGREVARIERDWAPAQSIGDVITDLRFDPDGRLSFTWLRGAARAPVSERLSVPSVPRS